MSCAFSTSKGAASPIAAGVGGDTRVRGRALGGLHEVDEGAGVVRVVELEGRSSSRRRLSIGCSSSRWGFCWIEPMRVRMYPVLRCTAWRAVARYSLTWTVEPSLTTKFAHSSASSAFFTPATPSCAPGARGSFPHAEKICFASSRSWEILSLLQHRLERGTNAPLPARARALVVSGPTRRLHAEAARFATVGPPLLANEPPASRKLQTKAHTSISLSLSLQGLEETAVQLNPPRASAHPRSAGCLTLPRWIFPQGARIYME